MGGLDGATVSGAGEHRPVLVLQHRAWERPGLIRTALDGIPTVTRGVLDETRDALGESTRWGGVVVMGGPMGALDDDAYPGLRHERRFLAEAVGAEVPVLGVCLGMQLLGVALGATLSPGAKREIGFAPVDLAPAGVADPLLAPLARASLRPTVMHWHGDVVSLPPGATLLASTPGTPVQAFRAGSAVGLQLHLEVDEPLLEEWLTMPEMVGDLAPSEIVAIRREGQQVLPTLTSAAITGFSSFAAAVRARRC